MVKKPEIFRRYNNIMAFFFLLIALILFANVWTLCLIDINEQRNNQKYSDLRNSAVLFQMDMNGLDHLNNNDEKMFLFVRRDPYAFEFFTFIDENQLDDINYIIELTWDPDFLIVVTTESNQNNDWDHWTIDWLEWQYTGQTAVRDNTGIDFGDPGIETNRYHTFNQGVVVYSLRDTSFGIGDNIQLSKLYCDTQSYSSEFIFFNNLNPYNGGYLRDYMDGDVGAWVSAPFLAQSLTDDPATTINIPSPNGNYGWYKTSPSILFTRTDEATESMNSIYAGIFQTRYSYDASTYYTYSVPFNPSIQGRVDLYYYSIDKMENVESQHYHYFWLDTVVPFTTISLTGIRGPGDWYNSNVIVTLSANDATSGVDYIQYNINSGGWTTYTDPFNLTTPENTADSFTVQYRSIDNAGCVESINSEVIVIDKNPKDIRWISPSEGQEVIFEVDSLLFNFTYNYEDIDNAELYIEGVLIGEVWNFPGSPKQVSIELPHYNDTFDGDVIAELIGYKLGAEVVRDSRNFFFSKKVIDVWEVIDSNTEIIGEQLYFILHDPSGDGSYSSFESGSTMSIAVGCEVTEGTTKSLEVGVDFDLFGVGGGVSGSIEKKTTSLVGYDFCYEISSMDYYTSSVLSDDPNFIGPGYGDIYYGEAWVYKWQLAARNVTYYNMTTRYEKPELKYGINRTAEVGLNEYDDDIDPTWIAMNPVHNGFMGVDFFSSIFIEGSTIRVHTDRITETSSRSNSFDIEISEEAQAKIGASFFSAGGTLTITTTEKNYEETSSGHYVEARYHLFDNEGNDQISMDIGLDPLFGTYIFRTNYFETETSNPLEHGTTDYIPPVIDIPTINLDSNGDGIGPYLDDSPIVTTHIFDESGVQTAYIWFYDENTWDTRTLTEQAGNPGTWEGAIPSHPQSTTISWYLEVWDNAGLKTKRKNEYNENFEYIVLNRAPNVDLITPNGGEVLSGEFLINWTSSDPDNDILTFTLAYNLDNTGWHLIAEDIQGTTYLWDVNIIPNSFSVQLLITANDGYDGISTDECDYVFSIENPPPPSNAIPFSNYYLTFVIVAVTSIIIYNRRKFEFNRK